MQLALHGDASPHPWPERQLVPWWLRGDGAFFRDLGGALQRTMAMSVAEAHGSETILQAIAHKVEVVLEPEADINVLAPARRPVRFAASGVARKRPYEPDGRRRTARFFETYALDTIETERLLGASCFVPPHHLVGAVGTLGRRRDLLLQQIAHDYWRAEVGPTTPLTTNTPRRFAAAATFSLETLADPAERRDLIRLYADLPGDLLWIRIADLSDGTSHPLVAAAADFLFRLRDAAGRDLVAVGLGTLAYPFMAAGLSAALGFGFNEYYRGPRVRRDQPENSFRIATFHQDGLRNVVPSAPGDLAHLLFAAAPCRCRYHPASLPPRNGAPRRYHSASCRIQDAHSLSSPPIRDAEDEILRRVEVAEQLSAQHAPARPFPAEPYRIVVAIARSLRGESLEATG
jgi:hypothetical protein